MFQTYQLAIPSWDLSLRLVWQDGQLARLAFEPLAAGKGIATSWLPSPGESPSNGIPDTLREKLERYFAGGTADFRDVPVKLDWATPFQREVYEVCRTIPWGERRTYGELARLVGRPRAARAVGNAMKTNRVPIVIPCHRVVPAGGGLGGFSAPGGVRLKERLLRLESGAPTQRPATATGRPSLRL